MKRKRHKNYIKTFTARLRASILLSVNIYLNICISGKEYIERKTEETKVKY